MEARTTLVSVVINIFSKSQKGPTPKISAKFKATSIGCRIIPHNRTVTAKHARRILAFDWSGRLVDTANMTRAFNKTVSTTAIEFKIVTAIWFLYKSSVTFSLASIQVTAKRPGWIERSRTRHFAPDWEGSEEEKWALKILTTWRFTISSFAAIQSKQIKKLSGLFKLVFTNHLNTQYWCCFFSESPVILEMFALAKNPHNGLFFPSFHCCV